MPSGSSPYSCRALWAADDAVEAFRQLGEMNLKLLQPSRRFHPLSINRARGLFRAGSEGEMGTEHLGGDPQQELRLLHRPGSVSLRMQNM